MQKTILITGSTDGIGLAAATTLVSRGHRVLVHGRSPTKVAKVQQALSTDGYTADLSQLAEVEALATAVSDRHGSLDVLVNNAGVYRLAEPVADDQLDPRFMVNVIAPYLLTRRLLPLIGPAGRVVNLSSAAQAPVDPEALAGRVRLSDSAAYAQSKLALTMWSRGMALSLGEDGPAIIAVNPGSMLGTNMVRQAYGVNGADVSIGAEVLADAALSDAFDGASGRYFDNDLGRFSSPHPDASDSRKVEQITSAIEAVLAEMTQTSQREGLS